MKRTHYVIRLALLCCFATASPSLWAQVTTATLIGVVTDTKGEPLVGATVTAEHEPSGTFYGTATRADGRYTIPNMRVGGPYKVNMTYTGYKGTERTGIYLNLAQKLNLDVALEEASLGLGVVDIVAETGSVLNGQRTGAATNISNEQIRALPTISRSASDYYRLTPQSDGNSFGGRNDQYNNFSLDGTIFNNPFGLDAATPGGQTDAQPVSLDAIDQIQVSLAPYDVTQAGFTGAAINAVTKSGTNQFRGTVFGFYRNQDMVGSKVDGAESKVPDITQGQYGFSLGGPIIKNKLFFFANAEIERRQDLGTAGFVASRPGLEGPNVSRTLASDFEAIRKVLRDSFQYETGEYEGFTHNTYNNKALVKLDWNINRNHKFSLTGNWLDAYKQKPAHPSALGSRGPDQNTLQFQNSGYRINNVIYSGIAELKSVFGARYSNKLQLGRTAFRDTRDPFSTPFPSINISKNGTRYLIAGHEPFSINNALKQDVFQVNDQFSAYLDDHTLTVGFALEKFQFDNSFNLGVYPGAFGGYASVDDFLASVASGQFGNDVRAARAFYASAEKAGQGNPGGWALAETNVGQLALFLQDEIAVSEDFNLTLGVRVDKPLYFNTVEKIEENIARNCCYDQTIEYYDQTAEPILLDQKNLPSGRPLFSPRLGFNWDLEGDRSKQLRGGFGAFTGRFPFVWVGNQVANPNAFFYCTTDPNFKFPQVWRGSLGYDHKFGGGFIFTTDLIYTKDVNAMMVRNYGLRKPTARLSGVDNRPIYNFDPNNLTGDDRANRFDFFAQGQIPQDAYVFSNTGKGYTFNWSAQLQRDWGNSFYTSLAYNFGIAKDAASIDAEISSDAYQRNPAYGDINQAVLTNSLYGNRHRVVGVLTKKFTYGRLATIVSAFTQWAQGGRYSFTYNGDINNDGSGLNDLVYIPTDAQIDQMAFSGDATPQRAAMKAFIAQDDYLSANRGKVAEKYASLNPWYNNWDIRILQDLGIRGTNNIQLSIDVLNFTNLLSSKWGVRQIATNTGLVQPFGVSVDPVSKVPTYSFNTDQKTTYFADPSFLSRWQAQVGLRYSF
jgi:hypothetical protein